VRIGESAYLRMRTTVTLDDDVFAAAKALAEGSGKQLGAVLSHLARRGLRAPAEGADRNGLPVFKVSPDAPVIPSRRAAELLAEDAL
jgi:hypothetical protein